MILWNISKKFKIGGTSKGIQKAKLLYQRIQTVNLFTVAEWNKVVRAVNSLWTLSIIDANLSTGRLD
jgi:hypothetical protein